jgi:glycosyltransferase involved in cell wall biosynthesis
MTTISIATPAYNAEAWLRETLESALAQTHLAHEIIVVNDESDDRTEELLKVSPFTVAGKITLARISCASPKAP